MDYKKKEIKEYFYNWINDQVVTVGEDWIRDNMDDLHYHAFNTDYYIIGTQKAIEWMGDKVFDIIGHVKDYEQDNFGEVTTDFTSPEKLVNMYVYIIGEEIVNEYRNEKEAAKLINQKGKSNDWHRRTNSHQTARTQQKNLLWLYGQG